MVFVAEGRSTSAPDSNRLGLWADLQSSAAQRPSVRWPDWAPVPRGSKYPMLESCGSENHTLNGFGWQKPQLLGSWTLWG